MIAGLVYAGGVLLLVRTTQAQWIDISKRKKKSKVEKLRELPSP